MIIVPVAYAVLGGFKDNGQLAADPVGLPNPWVTTNYTDTLTSPTLLAAARQQHAHRGPVDAPGRRLRGAGGVRLRPPRRSPAARSLYTLFTLGPAVPVGGRDPAAVHPRPRPGPARQPARDRPARGGLRPAADDRHPAAVLPEHPDRAGGRRVDRRLRPVRLLLADPAADVASRPSRPSACWPSSPAGTSSCCRS